MFSKVDYVELTCTDVCEALDRGLDKRRGGELGRPILESIEKSTT